jgi:hypothetical protein
LHFWKPSQSVRQCFIKAQSERDKTVCVSSQTTKKGESSQNENEDPLKLRALL